MTSWKDVLLGVLSGWVALGILSTVITRRAMSACSVSVTDSLRSQEGVVALLIAVAIGLLVWWFAKKSHRESFSYPESQEATKYMSYETQAPGQVPTLA